MACKVKISNCIEVGDADPVVIEHSFDENGECSAKNSGASLYEHIITITGHKEGVGGLTFKVCIITDTETSIVNQNDLIDTLVKGNDGTANPLCSGYICPTVRNGKWYCVIGCSATKISVMNIKNFGVQYIDFTAEVPTIDSIVIDDTFNICDYTRQIC